MSFATLISGDRVLPGDDLAARVALAAGALDSCGLRPGDVVAILMRNDFPFLEISLAAMTAGITAIPLNWHARPEEISFILQDAGVKMLFAHADLLLAVRQEIPITCQMVAVAVPPEVRSAYRVSEGAVSVGSSDTDYEAWLNDAQPYQGAARPAPQRLFYTSGTTGKPKGVVRRPPPELAEELGHRSRRAHGLDLQPIRAAMPGPLYHSAPNVYALNCVHYGELLVLQPRFDANELLDLVERHQISHFHAVPTMFNRLLKLPTERRQRFDPSSLKAVVHGAAMCPIDVKRAIIDWWGPVVLEYYAATEVGIITACTSSEWLSHPGTVGRTPNGVTVGIFGDDGKQLSNNEIGEIMFQCDISPFVRYHERPEADAEMRRGDWLTLGDIGYMDAEGFVWICDRKNDMVISGGVNIFPTDVEEIILTQTAVKDCAVFGIPDRDLGEVLAAYVVVEPCTEFSETAQIADAVRNALGYLKMPQVIRVVDSLPRDDSGKIAKRKLRETYNGQNIITPSDPSAGEFKSSAISGDDHQPNR
jgi:long-chain acyl-CoA synthetase